MILDLAKAWVTSCLFGLIIGMLTTFGVCLLTICRFFAESGPIDGRPPCYFAYEVHNGVCWHYGWGYGPVAVMAVLLVWTVVACFMVSFVARIDAARAGE